MYWKKWSSSPLTCAAAILFLGLAAGAHATDLKTPRDGGDFTLSSLDGPLKLSDLNGKVVLLFFGYTSCPDICPLSLARISACLASMEPAQAEQVRGLFVTLDPARDTPERMGEYADFFHPNIVGLTGTTDEIGRVAKQYGIDYQRNVAPDSALGYTISHPTSIYVIDATGSLVGEISENTDSQTLRDVVLELLSQSS